MMLVVLKKPLTFRNRTRRFCTSSGNVDSRIFGQDSSSLHPGIFENYGSFVELNNGPRNNTIVVKLNSAGHTKGLFPLAGLTSSLESIYKRHPLLSVSLKEGFSKVRLVPFSEPPSLTMAKVDTSKATSNQEAHQFFNDALNKCVVQDSNKSFISFEHEDEIKPPCRAILVTNTSEKRSFLPDALVISLPQYLADPISSMALVDDILTHARLAIKGVDQKVTPLPALLPSSRVVKACFKPFNGILGKLMYKLRMIKRRMNVHNLKCDMASKRPERTSLYEEFTLSNDLVSALKKLAKENEVSMTSLVSALALKSMSVTTLEKYKAPKMKDCIVLSIHDDLRKLTNPPIEKHHLGNLSGSIYNSYFIDEDLFQLAKKIHKYNKNYVDSGDVVLSRRELALFFNHNEDDKGVLGVKNPSLEVANLGEVPISEENIQYFGVNSVSLITPQNHQSFMVNFVTLPGGSMSVTLNYPYPTFFCQTSSTYKEELHKNMLNSLQALANE